MSKSYPPRPNQWKTKVASTDIKLQWGSPPKPNLWKTYYDSYENSITIESPILESPIRFQAVDFIGGVGNSKYLRLKGFKMDRASYFWSEEVFYYSDLIVFPKSYSDLSSAFKLWLGDAATHAGWRKEIKDSPVLKIRKGMKLATEDRR